MFSLKVVALGPLTVIYDEVNITGQLSRTTQLLLIYLLTTAKPHEREVLAELFWPERSDQQAASNLRTVLTELRKVCAAAVVITRTHVAVAPGCIDYDVAAFRLHLTAAAETITPEALNIAAAHWEAALQLYQRPFLAGLREPPSAELQLWLTLERELLYHQMLSTLRQLVRYYANSGERTAALAWAKRWLALEPVDEDALQQVMRLSAQQGEPETALTYYRSYLRAQQQGPTTVAVTSALATLVNEILQGVYAPVLSLLPPTNHGAGAKPDPSGPWLELPERPTNLPGTLAPLIGRSQEIDQVCTLLLTEKQRLVTIVGLGGQGKTRLAVAVAAACQAAYPDGVWFVALEGITGPCTEQTQVDSLARRHEQVANAIGAALGQSLIGTQPATEQVMRQLQDKTLCLVLDNFEPLIPVAPFLLQLLEGAPGLALLVTSRIRLNLLAERVYLLGGLTLPTATTTSAVAQSAAGQLFMASARRHLTDFAIDDITAPAIARLCQLTAGMPLALILASTWVEHLNPAEIVVELEANLALLSADTLHLPLRQQNVAQIIEVSWQALSPVEQLALAQLSVFVEPFTRQAAQAVANVTLAQLRTLADKALLTVDGPGAYHFHPLIHQFARQKLADLDDTASLYPTQARQRHATYMQQLVQRLTTTPAATLQEPTGKHRWSGYGDVQAAIAWCLAHQPATAFAFLVALSPLWERYGYIGDARHWLQMGLACAPPATLAQAHLLRLSGYFAEKQQELPVARQQLVEALQLYQQLDHAEGEAATLSILGWVTFRERPQYTDVQPALAYFERSLQLYRSLHNHHKIADQLRDISQLLIIENQRSAAAIQQYLQEALTIYQALEERSGQASIWKLLGHLELAQDNYATAAIYLDQAIACAEATTMDHERAWIYHIRSSMAYSQHDTAALHQYGTKAYTIFKAIQDPHGIMLSVFWIGLAEYQLGNHQAALLYLRESLALAHSQHLLYWIARNLAVMTAAALALQIASAAALGGAAEAICVQQEAHFTKWEQQDLAALLATARAYRQNPSIIRQWEQGKALPLTMVLEWALQGLFQAGHVPALPASHGLIGSAGACPNVEEPLLSPNLHA